MMDWHAVIERAVDRNRVVAILTRIGDPDVDVEIGVAPIQYQDTTQEGARLDQQTNRWMVPARRLSDTDFPLPPLPGDMLRIAALGLAARVETAAPGFAGGEVVRWDLTILGGSQ
jgi:hypothetical protein